MQLSGFKSRFTTLLHQEIEVAVDSAADRGSLRSVTRCQTFFWKTSQDDDDTT